MSIWFLLFMIIDDYINGSLCDFFDQETRDCIYEALTEIDNFLSNLKCCHKNSLNECINTIDQSFSDYNTETKKFLFDELQALEVTLSIKFNKAFKTREHDLTNLISTLGDDIKELLEVFRSVTITQIKERTLKNEEESGSMIDKLNFEFIIRMFEKSEKDPGFFETLDTCFELNKIKEFDCPEIDLYKKNIDEEFNKLMLKQADDIMQIGKYNLRKLFIAMEDIFNLFKETIASKLNNKSQEVIDVISKKIIKGIIVLENKITNSFSIEKEQIGIYI